MGAANIKANVQVSVSDSGDSGHEGIAKGEPNCVRKGAPCSWAACCEKSTWYNNTEPEVFLECKKLEDTDDPALGYTFCMPCACKTPTGCEGKCNVGPTHMPTVRKKHPIRDCIA